MAVLCYQEASSDVVGRELEDRDGVGNVPEVGAGAKLVSELAPLAPGGLVGADAGGRQPMCHVRVRSTVAMCHIIAGVRWKSCQYLS